jgi:putative peptidoglycan lipid II flippase
VPFAALRSLKFQIVAGEENDKQEGGSRVSRLGRFLHPSHSHSAFSATVLLMCSTFLSGIIGLVRGKYIAHTFGAGPQTDAYNAAFRLPDLMNNFLVGGAVSITFVTLLNRYRERGEEREGERLLSIVMNLMTLVLLAASIALMFLAAPYIRWTNAGFLPAQVQLSAFMTRILLPAQIFFFAGGVLGAPLLVRKQFLYQALTPILYNLCIILGGMLLASRIGIPALAAGATAGAFIGSFLLNAAGAAKNGVRYFPEIDLKHPGLREWLKLSLPLMFGFTLPFLEPFFTGFFASHSPGDITRLTNAKQLFTAPMAVLAQAAGVASLPFFSQLWAAGKRREFALGVADSASRVMALGILASTAMIALALPLVGLVFGGGRFTVSDVQKTAIYFALYAAGMFLWSAQAIYSRAFYAAGITWLPMLSSTAVMIVSLWFYLTGYRHFGAAGLAIASDAGIALQTLALAVLLHLRRMVSLASIEYGELARCLAAGAAGGVAAFGLQAITFGAFTLAHRAAWMKTHWSEAALLIAGALLWVAVADWVLRLTGSALPQVMRKRLEMSS